MTKKVYYHFQRLNQELDIWKKLQHVHIVPLYGVVNDMGHYASMVSPWMDNGNASKYFEGQDVQTTLPRRLKLLYEVASGLEYLHCFSPPIIHGDLKASNILVSDSGHALLTDFGISTLIEEATGTEQSASTFAGSVRWMAFELFNPYGSTRSIEESQGSVQLTTYSDIWSFGSTVLEVLSGKLPYYYRKKDVQVVHEILLGIKPLHDKLRSAYPSISSEIWSFLLTCWKDDPRSRPSITHVKDTIGHLFKERRRMGIVFNEEGFL
ncbi:kinase-like protein [Fomitiporia mediterranea MF3/22]|uniref:kinase-like protein n=1 Tax=Fomitiporia mediterranea (strain MF3/22) TaxID=694068 RepID=UPI0004407FB2|nr:kinase-like protein [Fomitiporia mediterranea MF3/22]EJD05930.1 kinase-like protein [Fomitiporia mediterranea MF3/22]